MQDVQHVSEQATSKAAKDKWIPQEKRLAGFDTPALQASNHQP
jgi:hypothetical protein